MLHVHRILAAGFPKLHGTPPSATLPPESTTFSTPTQHLAHVSLRLVRMAVGGMRELD